MKINKGKTARGFRLRNFADAYGLPCSIQKSSLATDDAIWFGVDDAQPKRLIPGQGWTPFPIPGGVQLHTRMHLTRKQVAKLLPILQHFVDTGELP